EPPSEAQIGDRHIDAPRDLVRGRHQPLVVQTREITVDQPLVVGNQAFHLIRQPHELESLRMQPALLTREVGEILCRDRRPARIVGAHWCRGLDLRRRDSGRETCQRPELEQTFLRPQWPYTVRGCTAVGRQQEVMRETEVDGGGIALRIDIIEIADIHALPLVLRYDRIVQLLPPGYRGAYDVCGELGIQHRFGDFYILGMGHACHTLVEYAHEMDVHLDELT